MTFDVRKKFLQFAEDVNKRRLMPYQIRVAMRVVFSVWRGIGAEIGIIMARQCGKTEGISLGISFLCLSVMLYWNMFPSWHSRFDDGLRIGIFSPKAEQAQTDLDRARRALPKSIIEGLGYKVKGDNYSTYEVVKDEGTRERVVFLIKAISASETSNIESATFDLIILEEAQDITERKMRSEIEPMGAARNATRVYVGTVGYSWDFFYKTLRRMEERDPDNYFNVTDDEVIACNFRGGNYKTYVDGIIAKHGAESDFYLMKFKNQWMVEKGHPFTEKAFRAHCAFDKHWRGTVKELPRGLFLVGGLDVARDVDDSVLTIAIADYRYIDYDMNPYPDLCVIDTAEWHGVNYDEQFSEMDKHIRSLFPILRTEGTLAIDATGDRGAMVERFENAGYSVVPAVFSSGTKTGKGLLCQEFMDQWNTYHFEIAAATESVVGSEFLYDFDIPEGHEVVPASREFTKMKNQWINMTREYRGNRLDLRADGDNNHDDYPMSAVLAVHAARNLMYVNVKDIQGAGKRATGDLAMETRIDRGDFGAPESIESW